MKKPQPIHMRVYALLASGKRLDYRTAGKRLGISMRQYQRAISYLRAEGHPIDTDLARRYSTGRDGRPSEYTYAIHQLIARKRR